MTNNYITYFDNVLNKTFCEDIIEYYEKTNNKELVENNNMRFTQLNLNQSENGKPYVDYIMRNCFMPLIEEYKIKFNINQFPDDYAYEQLRIKKYMPNNKDEFKLHVDVEDYPTAKRFLVFFVYLNDNEKGLTCFPDYDIKVKPKTGRVLMFPPLWTHRHYAEKPIKEPKYILGSYLHYVGAL